MTTTTHMGMSVSGALRNWRDDSFEGAMTIDGEIATPAQAKAELIRLQGEGVKLIPCCSDEECPDFDPITGCPGHVKNDQIAD